MEEKKTLLFIFNPFSGKAQIKNQLMDIVDTMVKAGYEVTIYKEVMQSVPHLKKPENMILLYAAEGTVHLMKW